MVVDENEVAWARWLTATGSWWMLRNPHLVEFKAILDNARLVAGRFDNPHNRPSPPSPTQDQDPKHPDPEARAAGFAALREALATNSIGLSEDSFRVGADARKLIRWLESNDRWWMVSEARLPRFRAIADGLPTDVIDALVAESGYSSPPDKPKEAGAFAALKVMVEENTLQLPCLASTRGKNGTYM